MGRRRNTKTKKAADAKLLEETIEPVVVKYPAPEQQRQHLCLDKGYDNPSGE